MTLVISDRDPLKPVSQYEQIAAEVELDRFKIKLPERSAKIILESPSLAQIDPELEDFEGFQRRKAAEDVKRAEMQKVAQETGAPMHLLRALEARPSPISIDTTAHDEQHARAYQLGLDEEMMAVDNAIRVEQNVQNVANQARGMLNQAHNVNPIYEIPRARASPWEFILAEADDDQLPIEYAPRRDPLPIPAVPDYDRAARALVEAGMTDTGTSVLDLANSALQTTTAIANAGSAIANAGSAIAPVAGDATRGLFQVASSTVPMAGSALMFGGRMGGRALMGGVNLTSAATRGVANALSSLTQARLPISHRGHDHLERAGINISVQDFIANHRI